MNILEKMLLGKQGVLLERKSAAVDLIIIQAIGTAIAGAVPTEHSHCEK